MWVFTTMKTVTRSKAMNTIISRVIFLIITAVMTVSCGGGGGGGTQTAGIGGTGVTSGGTVTGFGSIFVNGIEYNTSAATITIDKIIMVGESNMKLGMYVLVRGTLDSNNTTGTANTVTIDTDLEGPIDNPPMLDKNTNSRSFTVLGQNVIVNKSSTVFAGNGFNFSGMAQFDTVEIYGLIDAAGNLQATRIEKKGTRNLGVTTVEVRGTVGIVSPTSFELLVGTSTLTINHDGSTDFSTIPGGMVVSGQKIELDGTLTGATVILASEVELQSGLLNTSDSNIELEGLVTGYVSDANFRVNGQQVNASGATLEPVTLTLANNIKVEVEGTLVNGVLVANKVEGRSGEIEIEATVSSIADIANNHLDLSFDSAQTVTVTINSQSKLKDNPGSAPFTLQNIAVGNFLDITARTDNAGNIIVIDLTREPLNQNGTAELKGPVSAVDTSTVNQESVTILGITYPSDATTVFKINDVAIQTNPRASFFAQLGTGSGKVVKIEDNMFNSIVDGVANVMDLKN